jgi:hypothetical protein
MSSYKKPSNYTSIPVTCSTSREPLKTSKIDRIQQSPWRPATLRNLKGSLTPRLQSDKFLYNKILIAYYSVLAYTIALVRPLLDISNLINKLNFAIIIYKAKHLLETEIFFTDRRYYLRS